MNTQQTFSTGPLRCVLLELSFHFVQGCRDSSARCSPSTYGMFQPRRLSFGGGGVTRRFSSWIIKGRLHAITVFHLRQVPEVRRSLTGEYSIYFNTKIAQLNSVSDRGTLNQAEVNNGRQTTYDSLGVCYTDIKGGGNVGCHSSALKKTQ